MSAEAGPELGLRLETGMPYEQAVAATREALKGAGFGVLTEIDVRETLKQKIGADFKRYVILGACMPRAAHRALSAADEVGLLLPCNVIVYEQDDGSVVEALNPLLMSRFFDAEDIHQVAREVHEALTSALAEVAGA